MPDSYYDAIAPGYDELHGAEQLEKISYTKNLIDLPADFRLLDVGCGTGISTAAWHVREKVVVDPSRGLLAVARRNYPRIRFEQAAAEKLPFGNHSFDVVISLTAIQNFEDVPTALGEIARVGKDQFVLSFLKNSPRKRRIQEEILKIWPEAQMHTQQKDMIVTVGF